MWDLDDLANMSEAAEPTNEYPHDDDQYDDQDIPDNLSELAEECMTNQSSLTYDPPSPIHPQTEATQPPPTTHSTPPPCTCVNTPCTCDDPIPVGLCSVSRLDSPQGTILFCDLLGCTSEGMSNARSLLAHALNTHSDLDELHVINMSRDPNRQRARDFYTSIGLPTCSNLNQYAYHPDGTRISIHNDTEEYRIGKRKSINLARLWEPPMITEWDQRLTAQINSMLHSIHINHTHAEHDDIYSIIANAQHTYIAYDDPHLPRPRQSDTSTQVCLLGPRIPPPRTSTHVRAKDTIESLGLHEPGNGPLHESMHTPTIIAKLHTMTRRELESVIESYRSLRKRRRTQQDKNTRLTRRRIMTSRWSPAQKAAYSRDQTHEAYTHDTSIT